MGTIKIDDVEYDTDTMSDDAKGQISSLQFTEAQIVRLRNEIAVAETAKMAYINGLKAELEKDGGKSKKSKS